MADFCAIPFVVGFITVIGHGIWVLIAAVCRALLGAPEDTPQCVRCSAHLRVGWPECPHCGLNRDSPLAVELADLAATRRQLERFRDRGGLAPEWFEQTLQSVRRRQHFLLGNGEPEPVPFPPILATRAVEVPMTEPVRARSAAPEEVLDVLPVPEPAAAPETIHTEAVEVLAGTPPVVPAPAVPRRSLGEMLSGFMEERNILWGELVGGLLIVGCSIALVISLWQTLEQIAYFPFLVLGGITAALMGTGQYTRHHWKLETTSRGLLVIGTLLVPLDFMVLAGLVGGTEGSRLLALGVASAALALFAFLLRQAGRVLVPNQSGVLLLAVLGASASQLLVPALLPRNHPETGAVLIFGALPLLCQATGAGLALRQASRSGPREASDFLALFGLLGWATFSFAVALGFLAYWTGAPMLVLQRLAVVTAAAGVAPLLCGAWTHRRLTDEPALPTVRTGGTALALVGAFVMTVAVALAWPRPGAVVLVCGLNFVVLTAVAFRFQLAAAHGVALPCLVLGYLTAWYIASPGPVPWDALLSARSGTALTAIIVLLGIAAEWLAWTGQRHASTCYALGSAVTALASLVMVTSAGLANPIHAAVVYGLYGAGSLAMNLRWRRSAGNYLGLALLLGSTLWALQAQAPAPDSVALWGLVLAIEALVLSACSVVLLSAPSESSVRLESSWLAILAAACREMASVAALLAVGLAVTAPEFPGPGLQGCTAAILAVTLLYLARAYQVAELGWFGSVVLFGSLLHVFAWNLPGRSWPHYLALAVLADASVVLLARLVLGLGHRFQPLPARSSYVADLASPLTTIRVEIAVAGFACLLAGGLVSVIGSFDPPAMGIAGPVYAAAAPWAAEAGGLLGWSALLLTGAAIGTRQQAGANDADGPCVVGLVLVAFAAFTMTRWLSPMAGYRTLSIGFAGYALLLALAGAGRTWLRRDDAPAIFPVVLARWVQVAALAAVVLGVKAAVWHQDHLAAAAAVALAGIAGAVAAVGCRQEKWAFAAALGFNLAASLLVWHFQQGVPFFSWWVYLVQANCVANGTAALLWLAARKRLYGDMELRLSASPLLAMHNLLGLLANAVLFGLCFLAIFIMPTWLPGLVNQAGEAGGFLALVVPMAAAGWYAARASLRQRYSVAGLYGLLLGVFAGCTVNVHDTGRAGWAYQAVAISWIGLGMAYLGLGLTATAFRMVQEQEIESSEELPPRRSRLLRLLFDSLPHVRPWVEVIAVLVLLLALRESGWLPYPAAATAVAAGVLAMGLALWSRRQRHVYQFGLMMDLAGLILWTKLGPHSQGDFLTVNVLGLALAAAFWTGLELALEVSAGVPRIQGRGIPFHRLAIVGSLAALAVLVARGTLDELSGQAPEAFGALPWLGLLAVGLAVAVTLWDSMARGTGAAFYIIGLLAVGLAFNGQDLGPRRFGWLLALVLVGYVGLASAVAFFLPRLNTLRQRLRMPLPAGQQPAGWFAPAQAAVSGVVVLLSVWIAMSFEQLGQRLAGPLAVTALLPAAVLLAARFPQAQANGFRHAALALSALVTAELGWAILGATPAHPLLERAVILMTALAGLTLICGFTAGWFPVTWSDAARRLGPIVGTGAGLLAVAVLAQEAMRYDPIYRGTHVAPWAVAAVLLAVMGLAAAAVRFALMPGDDPLGLAGRGRTLYVYASEALLVLFLAQARLTMPYLFTGRLAPYYSLMLMVLAFAGVGLAEWFWRRGLSVLAEPLSRTGLFLPVLPLLAFWLQPALQTPGPLFDTLAPVPTTFDRYAGLLFLASLVYGLMAFSRRSFGLAVLAVLAANGALWALLYHRDLAFLTHPQLWLIPGALVLLAAEHFNRDRLPRAQSLGLRYLALGLLYVSATAEMFILGLGTAWWVPLPLMLLAVAGMLLGILLRVRAYLFLGTGFLLVVIFSMIWHAAVDRQQTWLWWASGIVLGGVILLLFAVFEKRRNDVQRVIEQFKGWA